MSNIKYSDQLEEGLKMWRTGKYNSKIQIARLLKERYPDIINISVEVFRKNFLSKYIGKYITDTHPALAEECEVQELNVADVSHFWFKSEKFSIFFNPKNPITYADVREDMISEMAKYAPVYPTLKRALRESTRGNELDDPHLLVVDPADIHIGKLSIAIGEGLAYDNKSAVARVHDGVRGLLQKSSGHYVDKVLLVIGNDILHIDNPQRQTSHGTPQDTDGMWYSNFKIAKKLYVDLIELLMQLADVHVVFNPSNHDYMSGFFLSDSVSTWFRNSKNVTFDVGITHRKYFQYHTSLIGTTHGDGAKGIRLPQLMAEEASQLWADSKHRYWYLHHIHHKDSKDYGSVCVEALRSPSGTDMWHHIKGFQNQPKAIEGFLHSRDHGQVARLTHIF